MDEALAMLSTPPPLKCKVLFCDAKIHFPRMTDNHGVGSMGEKSLPICALLEVQELIVGTRSQGLESGTELGPIPALNAGAFVI